MDRVHAVEPAKTAFATKAKVRRDVEAAGIPYTYVSSNFFAGYFLPSLNQPGATAPPRDKVVILGDGNPKGNPNPLLYKIANSLSAFYREFMNLVKNCKTWMLGRINSFRFGSLGSTCGS